MAINDYATISEAQGMLIDMATADFTSAYNTFLTTLITRASREIDRFTNREPGAYYVTTDSTLYFDGPGKGLYSPAQGGYYDNRLHSGSYAYASLPIGEIAAVPTSVAVAETGNIQNYTTWPSTDYYMEPYNALHFGLPYQRIVLDILYGAHQTWYGFKRGVQVTGKFGYSTTVPDDVKQAVLTQVMRWFKRGQQKYQDLAVQTDPEQPVYKIYDPTFYETIKNLRRTAI